MFENINHILKKKKVILLMISNREKHKVKSEGRRWQYLAVKELSALLKGTTFIHHDKFYCLNCLHCFTTDKKYVKIKIFVM